MSLSGNNPNSSLPAEGAAAITTSDSTVITPPRALYIGVGGDIVVTMDAGNDVTFKNIQTGSVLPIRPLKIKATGTTASSIVALY